MRTITLSDHLQGRIDALLAAIEQGRVRERARSYAAYERQQGYEEEKRRWDERQQGYEEEKRRWDERVQASESVRRRAAQAWSDQRFLQALGLRLQLLFLRRGLRPRELEPVPAPQRQPSELAGLKPTKAGSLSQLRKERIRLQQGREGEQRLLRFLEGRLDDAWVLVRGYRNGRGEADFVLVGPPGVCAIEVKYLSGLLTADSDDSWRRRKHGTSGNPRRAGKRVRDASGRSPSRQVRDVAELLERFLRDRMPGRNLRVRTAVVLTHDRSELGEIHAAVDLVATLAGLSPNDLVPGPGAGLGRGEVDEIAGLIVRDHRFHEEKLRKLPRAVAPGGSCGQEAA